MSDELIFSQSEARISFLIVWLNSFSSKLDFENEQKLLLKEICQENLDFTGIF